MRETDADGEPDEIQQISGAAVISPSDDRQSGSHFVKRKLPHDVGRRSHTKRGYFARFMGG